MTIRVLQTHEQNRRARAELQSRGLSYWPKRAPRTMFDRLRRRPPIPVGDLNKSWDVLLTLELLEQRLRHDDAVLDLGAFASEMPCVLHGAGFRRVSGIDFNPRIRAMPFAPAIDWRVGDAMDTRLPAGSLSAVSAISMIEHGYAPERLLREVARLLKPGGLFVGSTDYWQDKIDTTGVNMFGVDWRIFSREEILTFIDEARAHGLDLLASPKEALEHDLSCHDAPIDCARRLYTFLWFALIKRA